MHPSPVSGLLPSSHDCAICTEVQDIYRTLRLEDQQTLSKNVSRERKPLGVNIYRLLFVVLSRCTDNRVLPPPFGARRMSPRLHQGATYINTLLTAPHLDASRHIGQLHRDSKPPQACKGAKNKSSSCVRGKCINRQSGPRLITVPQTNYARMQQCSP